MNKKEVRFLTIFAVSAAFLLLIASIWDLQISKAIMDQNSIYGTLFQDFGMFPSALVGFVASEIIFVYALKKDFQPLLKGAMLLAGLGLAFWSAWGWVDGWMYYGTTTLNNIKARAPIGAANNNIGATASYSFGLETLIVIVVWLIGTFICYQWLNKKTLEDFNYLIVAAVAGLAVVYLTNSIISTMKTNWGRFRPYEVKELVAGAKASFTNWWQINGITGHQSFPSGHELAAISGVFLPFFVARKNVKLQQVLAYSALAYGLLMAFARVRLGAHFLSDVTVSAIIVVFTVFITMKVLGYSYIEEEKLS